MATFKWYLNRQGPQGQRGQDGAKGDPGNTPIFSDGQNTPTVYTMIIDLGDGNTFETKNLKYPMRDDGGDYLRYDISEDTVYLGEPNKADLAGKEGEVRLATTTSVSEETVLDTDAVSYELFEDNNEKVTTALGNLDDKIEDVDDKVDAEADIRARNDGILDNRISLAEGQITSLNNTKASKQELTDGLAGKANVIHTHTLSQITDAGSLAGQNVVDYQSQVINKPIIPTPGNGTITITQGGVTKGTFTTNQSSNSAIELDAGGGGSSLTASNGINISNDVISAKVDNDTINFDSSGNLVANIPDVSNFVTNSSLATTLQSYPTNTQLANTLEDYPTKTSQQNIINYELASWDDFTYSDKEFSYAKFPIIGSDECPFYYVEPTGDITATSTGFRFNNNCVEFFLDTYEITPYHQVCFKAKQGDRIVITSADYTPIIRYNDTSYIPEYDYNIDDKHTCVSDGYFSATSDFIQSDTSGSEVNYQIEVLQDCLIKRIETIKTRVVNPEGTYSFEYIMANNNPAIEFVIPMVLDGHIKAIFNPDIAGNGLKINSVNKDRIEADVDGTTIGINNSGQLTYIGTTGDVLPSQTGNSGKFLTTDGSVTSWATVPTATTSNLGLVQPDGTTITINNGVISVASSTPSNMVTTDTVQDITAKKNFTNTQVFSGGQYYSSVDGVQLGKDITICRTGSYTANIKLMSNQGDYVTFADGTNDEIGSIVAKNQKFRLVTPGNDKKIYRENSTPVSNPTNFLLEKDMLDGTTITYNSSTHKISAAGSTPTKKTITQASANVSESSGTVTVTDVDVTTSTMVTLYPSDTTTETWLANNLASNIITEGSGSFTFTINGTLPATFSMYYIIQGVS